MQQFNKTTYSEKVAHLIMQRIRSGELEQVAVVIRSLRRRDGQKNLSTGERKMLSSAKKILVSELALVLEQDYGQIEHIVEKTLV